ncbi:electron transfer flavoprotein alpha subunit apoprotein [Geoalkalibacter ferrihydriticus]|uniref:Electron transfer flavoprotein alpha subunit apoprotein n=1 Tax=Geoalkalibacter ferrihydriticus TaxID=392333 RepID=A0A1G9VZL9_9BACT|nr:electron transfer flavoprotein subunit alpha/FixB family protein [Geoalkalibacter ferrihydriticus]SDM77712.1 electron transfer flavoprotein alpha subunit apoprotein [Geoalkalibacter ferrihydriticus]
MALGKSPQPFAPGPILAVVELPGGELEETGKGLLSEASRLAKKLDVSWSTLCFSGFAPEVPEQFGAYGVPRMLILAADEAVADSPELQARLIAQVAREQGAGVVLLPHNDLGQALAPLLTARLDGPLFTEAVATTRDEKGLKLMRRALGRRVQEAWFWDGQGTLVLTALPQILSAALLPSMRRTTPEQVEISGPPPATPGKTRIIERIPPDPQTVDVSEAEVIFSAGLGCNEACFAQLLELCKLLNVSLGVTRPVYDLGWTGFERMVGQTGKTVAPRLYVALGISGSMHHIGGIKDSRRIISLNIDPKVPIFPNSDEGFVTDLNTVMPLLLERVKAAAGGAA